MDFFLKPPAGITLTFEAISEVWPPELEEHKFPSLAIVCGHLSHQKQKNECTIEDSQLGQSILKYRNSISNC